MPRGHAPALEFEDYADCIAAARPTIAALKLMPLSERANGMLVLVEEGGSFWRFSRFSVAVDGSENLVVAPNEPGGVWLRVDRLVDIRLPITFATADGAALFTTPVGTVLLPREFYWEVTTNFTGGASSAIGASSSNHAGYTTPGDLLGGAAGDVAATLVASAALIVGTVGGGFDTLLKRRTIFRAGKTIRHDRITSAFTAGAGALHCVAEVLSNLGA